MGPDPTDGGRPARQLPSARRYWHALGVWWWLPLAGAALASTASVLVIRQLPPMYEARTTLLVNAVSAPAGPTYTDVLLSQQLVKTYTQLAVQPVVLEQVAPRLGLDLRVEQLQRMLSAQPIRDTQLFTITADGPDAAFVRDLADTAAEVFIAQQRAEDAIEVIQPALLPLRPVQPRPTLSVALASMLGVLLALGLVYVLAWLDDTVKSVSDVERSGGTPPLGVVPEQVGTAQRRAPAPIEAYHVLRTALDCASVGRAVRSVLVTSPGPGEGKSTVATNLALAIARTGRTVILVDADLRAPSLHVRLGMSNDRGLATLLAAQSDRVDGVARYLRQGPAPTLRVLTSGPVPAEPAAVLQSEQLVQLLQQLERRATIVVVDSPPVLGQADALALALARACDASMLVVAASRTRGVAVARARAALAHSGTQLLGVVLNRVRGAIEASYGASAQDALPTGTETVQSPV